MNYDDGRVDGVGVINSTADASELRSGYDWAVELEAKDSSSAHYVDNTCRLFHATDLRPFTLEANGIGVNHGWGYDTNLDIVAEWVEPATAAAAVLVVEDATDPVWVPKAGDRVRVKAGCDHPLLPAGSEHTMVRVSRDYVYLDDGVGAESGWSHYRFEPAKPQPKFKVGDRVDLYRDGKPVGAWVNMTITAVTDDALFPINTDVGLPCFERELRPSTALPVGTRVQLTGTVSGNYAGGVNILVDGLPAGLNSRAFPATALRAA